MRERGCSHQRCMRAGEMGMGWGLSTGLVQWYCTEHYSTALARLSGLLAAARRSAATRADRQRPAATPAATVPELELAGAVR